MKKKKKFILMFLIIFIILVILIIILNILKSKENATEQLQQEKIKQQEDLANLANEYFSDKICPKGMATIYGHYNGSNDINDLYRALYKLVYFTESIYDEIIQLDDNQLAEYYKTNWMDIEENLGIDNKEKFISFVNYLKNVGYKKEKYLYCQLDKESYGVEGYYMTVNISFSYEGKEDLLNFKTYFSYGANLKPEVKFEPIE